ncbi:hypothetical protein [Nostoc cycadae]|uniref:hypothetical protein n=1 Tax=Nostoc cycadae TaxID=246795 RepID=UPI0011AF9B31|nr:hypothetical protein [Nostoc cycadae]
MATKLYAIRQRSIGVVEAATQTAAIFLHYSCSDPELLICYPESDTQSDNIAGMNFPDENAAVAYSNFHKTYTCSLSAG